MAKELKKNIKKEEKEEKVVKEEPKKEEEKLSKKDIKQKAEATMTLDEIKRENKRIKRRSSANRFFAVFFLLIIFYIFGVVSGVYFADKYNVTLFVKETKKENKVDPVSEECTIINCERITYSGVYKGSVRDAEDESGSLLSVSLELDENGYASMVATLNGEVVELSSGTYYVQDNKLIYNREYAKGGYDQNNNVYLVKVGASSSSYKYSSVFDNSRSEEVFNITENGFTLNSYAKAVISTDKFIELSK